MKRGQPELTKVKLLADYEPERTFDVWKRTMGSTLSRSTVGGSEIVQALIIYVEPAAAFWLNVIRMILEIRWNDCCQHS